MVYGTKLWQLPIPRAFHSLVGVLPEYHDAFVANLGNKALALKEAQQAVDLMPVSKDAYDGPLILQGLAQVYTWTGDYDRALDQLQTLLGMPGYISYGYLKTDPAWQPLRAHPRFQQLLASMISKR